MYQPGPSKPYIRDSVWLFFKDNFYILTLPNLYFGLEAKFIEEGKKVDCTEYKVNTFKGMKQVAPKGVNLFNLNVLNMNISKYDAIFLDFFGTLNKSVLYVLEYSSPGTKIVMTFLMARESKKTQEIIDIKNREKSYMKLFSTYNVRTIKYKNYNDTVPMCVFFCYKTK